MKALASPVAESGVQQGSNLSLSGLMSVSICMSMWKQKQKKEDEVYFAFVIFWPRFVFFCCKLVSVIDPVASLTHLAFGCPTCLGLCFLVQRVFCFFSFFFCFFLTPVDVFFAGGGAEQAVDQIFSGYACLKYKSYTIGM